MAKDKKVISVIMESDVIDILDMFADEYGFNRSAALNFIIKNILAKDGARSRVCDMVYDLYNMG